MITHYTRENAGTYDLLRVFAGDEVIGEMGVCTEQGCQCEGSWVLWGASLSAHQMRTLPCLEEWR